jgi:hypothetical protein
MKTLLFSLLISLSIAAVAQNTEVPVQINLKNGESFNVKHFGQLKCGSNSFTANYILIRGKYLGSLTEIKDYKDIEKIVFSGYSAEPVASVGNEKATVIVYKKNGVSVELTDTEIVMSCYGTGDLYNEIIVQVENPLTGKTNEKAIPTKDIKSVIFR